MNSWDNFYLRAERQEKNLDKPSPDIIDLVPRLKLEGVYRILDHCCGQGRHVKYLARQGFYVAGTDRSQVALDYAKTKCQGLINAELVLCDMAVLDFPDSYFGFTLSMGAIQHGTKDQREKALREISRTLKSGGLFFLRTISTEHYGYGLGDPIEGDEGSFDNIPDIHGGMRHYYTENDIKNILTENNFSIVNIDHRAFPLNPDLPYSHPFTGWSVLSRKN